MKVLFIAPQAAPHVLDLANLELNTMQALVGGLIEIVGIGETDNGNRLLAVVNEEGLLHGMPANRVAVGETRSATFVGNIIIVGTDHENEFAELTDAECKRLGDYIERVWTKFPGVKYAIPRPTFISI